MLPSPERWTEILAVSLHSTNIQLIVGTLILKSLCNLKRIECWAKLFFDCKTRISEAYWDSRLKCNEYRESFRLRSENSAILRNRGRKSSLKGSHSGGDSARVRKTR
jgi:hypothetical protein